MKQWAAQKAFTIVELLIVIVVIAILAAITVVAYTGIQNRAYDSAIQKDLQDSYKLMLTYYLDNTSGYPSVPDSAAGIKPTRGAYLTGRNNFYYCVSPDGSAFAFSGISKSSTTYAVTSDGAVRSISGNGGDITCNLVGGASGSWSAGVNSGGTWNTWVN